MPRSLRLVLLVACLIHPSLRARADEAPPAARSDEQRLRSAGLATDSPALLAFLQTRAKGEVSAERLKELLDNLEAKTQAARDSALGGLLAIGPPVIPHLRHLARDTDSPERAALARRGLKLLTEDAGALTSATVRLLTARRPADAARALLDFLPSAENDAVLEEIKTALAALARDKGKPSPVLLEALKDDHPLRRAHAILALCQGGVAEPRATLRKLLFDPAPSVRLRAGLALARVSDAKAVSTLISLLGDLSVEQTREVETFLSELASELAPKVPAGTYDGKKARDIWAKWWLDTEGPALLQELKKRTLEPAALIRANSAIEKLGDDSFEVRQQAEKDLEALGPRALPLLRKAASSGDLEVRTRAQKLLGAIKPEAPLSPVTLRLVGLRKPKGAAGALLAYLPFTEDGLGDDVQRALNAVAYVGGKPAPDVLAALKDQAGARRAAAAVALCHGPLGDNLPVVQRLLKDTSPEVQFKVALALARIGERSAVPVLIALLGKGPMDLAWQVEDALTQFAGETPPAAILGAGDANAREKCKTAWEGWWKVNAARVNLTRTTQPRLFRNLNIICDCNIVGLTGRVWVCGPDGKERWRIDGIKNPADVELLPGDRYLIAECQGYVVTERDRKGTVLWEHKVKSNPVSCQRLRNGNTFIATYNEILEVTRAGKVVYSHNKPGMIYWAEKQRNGNILYAQSTGQIIEMDTAGKEVRQIKVDGHFNWVGVELLPGGRMLVAQYAQGKVVEIDSAGKVLKTWMVQTPAWATRLRNGNTLVASPDGRMVVEFSPSGKEVWRKSTAGRPFRVRRY
jgi:HEAT repeat protein